MKGFIEFSVDYYRSKVSYYEQSDLTEEDLYEAKQLLKMIDDILDEGYMKLFHYLEKEKLVTRLRELLKNNGIEPFEIPDRIEDAGKYGQEQVELEEYLNQLLESGKACTKTSDNPFLEELVDFCEWVGYDEDTAYIFLLRDTLLPFLYYKEKGRKNIYPWLIGRKFMEILSGEEGIDDDLRYPIYNAADAGIKNYEDFVAYCKDDVLDTMEEYPEIIADLYFLLKEIKQEKIVVVESGCYGTFPMMLACMDDRVTIRMFTAVPYLWDLYGDHIFTKAYEKNRNFETLYSQDVLLKLTFFEDRKFMICVNENQEVFQKSIEEVHTIINRE